MKRTSLSALGALVVLGLALFWGARGEFRGTDDQAIDLISAHAPAYRPWTETLWRPSSDVHEKILFSFQASLGAVGLVHFLGRLKSRAKRQP